VKIKIESIINPSVLKAGWVFYALYIFFEDRPMDKHLKSQPYSFNMLICMGIEQDNVDSRFTGKERRKDYCDLFSDCFLNYLFYFCGISEKIIEYAKGGT